MRGCSDNFYPAAWDEWLTKFNPQGYGIDVDRQVLIYRRWGNDEDGRLERFIVVVNFSKDDQVVDVPFPTSDAWADLLNPAELTLTIACPFWKPGPLRQSG